MNQVESTPETSVNDVVIEMENLSLELEKTVEEKPKNKNINIYINHSEEDEREQFLLKLEKKDDCEDEEESDDDEIEDRDTPYFIEWQAPIVEWLAPIRDWQASGPSALFIEQDKIQSVTRALSMNIKKTCLNGMFRMAPLVMLVMVMALEKMISSNLNAQIFTNYSNKYFYLS